MIEGGRHFPFLPGKPLFWLSPEPCYHSWVPRKKHSARHAGHLHPGAVQHYVDAEAYERRYEGRTEDVLYFEKRLRGRCDILEYGAGAGRLTLPLARKGHRVTAVDVSPQMVSLLRERRQSLPLDARKRLFIRQGDMRTFATPHRFDAAVAAFHTVCHLYSLSDVGTFLRSAYRHLKPGGILVFDLPLPRIDMPEYDPIAQVRVTEMDGDEGPQLLTQRWYQPQEIAMHLHYAGFEKLELCSDFTSAPLDRETSVFTVTGRRPRDAH